MGKEYERPTDGERWKAVPSSGEPNAWCVVHPTKKIATGGTRGRAVEFNKDQATRYALALNIVDAGVDLGEAKEMLLIADELRDFAAIKGVNEACDDALLDWLRSIANAVEGDTTKEEV